MSFSEPLRVPDGALLSLEPLAPLERLSLPPELDGSLGTNRALGARSQIAAQNDVDAIKAWLARFVATKATFDTYRKESERLLLWSTTVDQNNTVTDSELKTSIRVNSAQRSFKIMHLRVAH